MKKRTRGIVSSKVGVRGKKKVRPFARKHISCEKKKSTSGTRCRIQTKHGPLGERNPRGGGIPRGFGKRLLEKGTKKKKKKGRAKSREKKMTGGLLHAGGSKQTALLKRIRLAYYFKKKEGQLKGGPARKLHQKMKKKTCCREMPGKKGEDQREEKGVKERASGERASEEKATFRGSPWCALGDHPKKRRAIATHGAKGVFRGQCEKKKRRGRKNILQVSGSRDALPKKKKTSRWWC